MDRLRKYAAAYKTLQKHDETAKSYRKSADYGSVTNKELESKFS